MQFYKNGFRGGNPDVKEAAPNRRNHGINEPLPEKVDVLIAGTGPAGLCLAAQLASRVISPLGDVEIPFKKAA